MAFMLSCVAYEGPLRGAAARTLGTIGVFVLLAALVITVARFVTDPVLSGERGHAEDDSVSAVELHIRAIASGVATGASLLLIDLVSFSPLGGHVIYLGVGIRHSILVLSVVFLAGALAIASISGLVRGVLIANRTVTPIVRDPEARTPPILPEPSDPSRPTFSGRAVVARIAFVTVLFLARVVQKLVDAINLNLRIIWRASYLTMRAQARAINALWTALVWTKRAIVKATISTLRVLRRALLGAADPVRRWARSLLAPVVILGVAATLAVYVASLFTTYLASGGLANGVGALALALLALTVVVAVWWSTTGWSRQEVVGAAKRLVSNSGATLFLVVLVLAWGDGVIGWLGVGPIRPGWLTSAGTLAIVFAVLYQYRAPISKVGRLFIRRVHA
jgi:hypothetical protein